MKKPVIFIVFFVFAVLALSGCASASYEPEENVIHCPAQVLEVDIQEINDEETGGRLICQSIRLKPLEGAYKDQVLQTEVAMDISNSKTYYPYHAGDNVNIEIYLDDSGGIDTVSVITLIRAPYIIGLVVVLLLVISAIGRKKGLKTVLALVFTLGGVIFVLLPLLASGAEPVLSALLVCLIVTVLTMFIVGGFNRKSLAAISGTAVGLIFAVITTFIINALTRVSAVELENVDLLMMSGVGHTFDYHGIVMASIMIGCMGAVMDVGMSVSSAINEIAEVDPTLSRKKLFSSGMAVGRDIMGTMANTLILAYTGCSLMMLLGWSVLGVSFMDMLNSGYVTNEVIRALCGSIGMISTIPFTALIASAILHKKQAGNAAQRVGASGGKPPAVPPPGV